MVDSAPRTLVMFDIDGTLLRSNALDDICYVRTAQSRLGDIAVNTDWAIYQNVTNSGITTELYQQLGLEPTPDQLEAFERALAEDISRYLQEQPEACQAIAGAALFVQLLQLREDVVVAIATGGWQRCAQIKLQHSGIPYKGLPFASASDAIEREQIMKIACDRARQYYEIPEFADHIYIGDGVWDLEASRRLGYRFIGIGEGDSAQKLAEAGATDIVPDFHSVEFEVA